MNAVKGSAFVAITSVVLYIVLGRMVKRITEIQTAHEGELRESRDRFCAFMDNSPTVAWTKDEHGNHVYHNRTYETRFGFATEHWKGKNDFNLWPRAVAQELYENDQRVLTTNQPLEVKENKVNPDGSISTWRNIKFPFTDSHGARFIGGIGIDITDNERVQSALRSSEAQLQLFIEHAPAALAMFDRQMHYLRVSNRWLQDYGLSGLNIIGRSHYEIFPEIPERWKEAHRQGMEGLVIRNDKDRFDRIDGSVQWLKWEILPWHDRNGRIGGILIFSEDVSEQHRSQFELAQLQHEFNQAQKMEAIGRLTGGIAHDFNNLLTVIFAQSDLLRRCSLEERALRRIDSIHQASIRAADLTRQLLAFSRKQVLQPSVQNIEGILSGIKEMLDRALGEDIDFRIFNASNLWPVLVDRSQIEQVIMNLVVNARDAMPTGGQLRIETRNLQVHEDVFLTDLTLPRGSYVQLSVTDTGAGMTAEVREKIFEPFFTTKPHGKGTGLGLATVFGIVKQSGGLLSVQSELGKGTCFRVYLPRYGGNETPAEKGCFSMYPQDGFHCSILLVDDQEDVCSAVAEYLESAGHRVLKANSIATALQIVEQNKDSIDVVVTDLVLAQGNGQELVARVASSGCKARPVFISGYTDDVIANHCSLDPDILFLQKPFEKTALLEKIWLAYQKN